MILLAALLLATRPLPPPADIAQSLRACRKIAESAQRLACFDTEAARLEEAQDSGAVVIVDRQQVHELRRQAFGLTIPSVSTLFRDRKGDDDTKLSAKLSGAHMAPTGRWVMLTEENQQWSQTDSETVGRDPHAGSDLAIRRAALGSFFCKVDGQIAFRCARDR